MFFPIPLEDFEDSYGNIGGLLGTRGDKFPNCCDLISEWFGRRRHV